MKSSIELAAVLLQAANALETDPMLLSPEEYEEYDQELWRSFPEERQMIADYLDPDDNVRLQITTLGDPEEIEHWLSVKKKNEGEPREQNLNELRDQIEKDGEISSPVILDLRNEYPLEGRHRMQVALDLNMDLPAILIMQGPDEMKLAASAVRLSKPKPDAGLDAYMADYKAATAPHPFMSGHRIYKDISVVQVYPAGGQIHLAWVQALDPKVGSGTATMKWLTDLADKHGVKMDLAAVPKGRHAMPKSKLVEFYKKFGFTGKADEMTREPKPTKIKLRGFDRRH